MLRLIILRKKHNLTQRKLADILGCSYSYMSMVESGQRELNSELAEKLAEYFGVTVEYLLGVEHDKKKDDHSDELVEMYESLDVLEKRELLDFAQFLVSKRKVLKYKYRY